MDSIKNTDYKRIWRETGMTPDQWHKLQDKMERDERDKLYCRNQVEILSCQCGSVWCEYCSQRSDTNKRVSEALSAFRWPLTRHVVLTLNRQHPPGFLFASVRKSRAIAKMLKKLRCDRWIWVLEFHADGYAHWHILTETPNGRMLGKRKIQRRWGYGHVWESYIKDEEHWRGIIGYHQKKGYLAGERKKHQLCLPGYLLDTVRVRKFGRPPAKNVSRETIKDGHGDSECEKAARNPRKLSTYRQRFEDCDSETTIRVNTHSYAKVRGSLKETREVLEGLLESVDYKTFNVNNGLRYRSFLDFLNSNKVDRD